ncbi:MAG: hypothetical protein ABIG28_01235 [archaeon]
MVEDRLLAKKGQVTVLIIIAILIVTVIVLIFVFRDNSGEENIPAELMPVYDYYQSCIEMETRLASQIAGVQGGRINPGEYFPGSEYSPFSSQLNFFGSPVPYWYYISANGVIKEQIPMKTEMEGEMEEFIKEGLMGCDFETFYKKGFEIELDRDDIGVDVSVLENKIRVEVDADLYVSRERESGRKNVHVAEVNSKLGKFYGLAKEIYDKEKSEAFLEDYAVDVLYNYVPVDGVEIQCSPKVWSTQNIMNELRKGLEENFRTIKFDGDYYELKGEHRDYFVVDKNVDEAVGVMYLENWPTKIEISGEGVDEEVMIAEAMGTEEGMGAMGFCYVPYHFVYDVSFPAMIQIYDVEELFQFPVAVIIDNNVPREANLNGVALDYGADFDLCGKKTQDVEVNIFDVNLNNVDANISYECFDQKCRIGQSRDGRFVGKVPGCVNGYLDLKAEGYADKRQLFSSNSESYADVILEREHEVEVELQVLGKELDGSAIVSFVKEDGRARTISMPEQNSVELSEGSYEVKVYIYGASDVVIPATTKRECVETPKGGIAGWFGGTEEKCFDINLPEMKIEYTLIGGGKTETYLLESELERRKVVLRVDELPKPRSLEELAKNFEVFETKEVDLEFR